MTSRTPTPALRPSGAPHTRLISALGVALSAVGCAPPGPRAAVADVEPLRQSVAVGAPVQADVSYLQSRPTLASSTGARLLLVHGTPGSASSWADYLLLPPAGAEVLAIDRPGFGRSGPPDAMPALAQQAAALAALLPDADRPVVLVGHSLGGPVAAYLAARLAVDAPERRVTLVLLAASLDPAQEDIHPMQHVGAWSPVRALLPRVIRNANTELMALKPELEALGSMLPQITARVLIVHGTQDDLVPVANVAYMQSRLLGAACVKTMLLPERNHFLPWNSESEVRQALHDALAATC